MYITQFFAVLNVCYVYSICKYKNICIYAKKYILVINKYLFAIIQSKIYSNIFVVVVDDNNVFIMKYLNIGNSGFCSIFLRFERLRTYPILLIHTLKLKVSIYSKCVFRNMLPIYILNPDVLQIYSACIRIT